MARVFAKGLFDPGGLNSSPTGSNPAVGTTGDLDVDTDLQRISNGSALRVFYTSATPIPALFDNTAGTDYTFAVPSDITDNYPSDCTRNNALGYAQALYMDIYPAYSVIDASDSSGASDTLGDINRTAPILIYWHGGGFDGGHACNRGGILEVVSRACQMGFHVIVPEYRRGWCPLAKDPDESLGLNTIGVTSYLEYDETPPSGTTGADYNNGNGFPTQAATDFSTTAEGTSSLAITDALDAVDWIIDNIKDYLPNAQKRFIHWGNSAGGSIVWQLAVTAGSSAPDFTTQWQRQQRRILLACPNFGSFSNDSLYASDVGITYRPLIYWNACGMDQLVPLRNAHIFWQDEMPIARGSFDIYNDLDTKSYRAILAINPTDNHGYSSWSRKNGGRPGDSSTDNEDIEHMQYAIQYASLFYRGESVPANHILFKVTEDLNTCWDYPAEGYYTTLSGTASFRILYSNDLNPTLSTSEQFFNGNGGTDNWYDFWLEDLFGTPAGVAGTDYYDSDPLSGTTSIGSVSLEGQACRTSTDDGGGGCPFSFGGAPPSGFMNESYKSNYDKRACSTSDGS